MHKEQTDTLWWRACLEDAIGEHVENLLQRAIHLHTESLLAMLPYHFKDVNLPSDVNIILVEQVCFSMNSDIAQHQSSLILIQFAFQSIGRAEF